MQSGGEAVDGRALDLRADTLRIDRPAAIYRVNDAMHFHGAVFDAGFHHGGSVALKRKVSGSSAGNTLWQRLAPTGFFSRQAQHALKASGIERPVLLVVGDVGELAIISNESPGKFQRLG